jgi:hypothetical protein
MAVLSIKWAPSTSFSVPATVTPREGDEEATEPELAPKPMLIWVQHPEDEEANQKIASVVLDPDKIRVGCSYFTCVKMTAEEASENRLLADVGKKYPRMIFLSRAYEVEKVVEGKISSSKLYSAMKKVAGGAYKGNFDKNVKAVIKLLGEFDKIANERKIIEEKEAKGPKPAEAKKLAKELEELEEREKEALEKRKDLLNPELKTA